MTFTQLRQALDAGIQPPSGMRRARGSKQAAVLILFTDEPDPRVTITERAHTLRRHAGQLSFPGGAKDPEDATVVDAAIREANEEVGLDPASVRVLGTLPVAWVPASGYDVTPVVALWDGMQQLTAVDRREVETVLEPRVADLIDPQRRVIAKHPGGFRGPAFWAGDLMIWGFTGYLLDMVLRVAGWEKEWDTSVEVPIPKRFLRD